MAKEWCFPIDTDLQFFTQKLNIKKSFIVQHETVAWVNTEFANIPQFKKGFSVYQSDLRGISLLRVEILLDLYKFFITHEELALFFKESGVRYNLYDLVDHTIAYVKAGLSVGEAMTLYLGYNHCDYYLKFKKERLIRNTHTGL